MSIGVLKLKYDYIISLLPFAPFKLSYLPNYAPSNSWPYFLCYFIHIHTYRGRRREGDGGERYL